MKKFKEYLMTILAVLIFIGTPLTLGVMWEKYRYETFREETGSDISYLKWKFVLDRHTK